MCAWYRGKDAPAALLCACACWSVPPSPYSRPPTLFSFDGRRSTSVKERRDPADADAAAAWRSTASSSVPPSVGRHGVPCLVPARVRCRATADRILWSFWLACLLCCACVFLCVRLFTSAPPRISYRYLFFVGWGGTLFWYYAFLFDPVVACRASAGASRAALTPRGRTAEPVPTRTRPVGLAVWRCVSVPAARRVCLGGARR